MPPPLPPAAHPARQGLPFRHFRKPKSGLMLLRLFVLLLAALLGTASLAVADPVFPPGQRIGIAPPPGLVLSKRFPGFEDADRKVVITLLDLPPRAYAEAQRSLFAASRPNVTIEKREMFPFASGIATLVTGKGRDRRHHGAQMAYARQHRDRRARPCRRFDQCRSARQRA